MVAKYNNWWWLNYTKQLSMETKLKSWHILYKCDPPRLKEALWREYQKWGRYLIAISTILHILMQKWLLCNIQKLENVEHRHVQYYSKQFYSDMSCQRL